MERRTAIIYWSHGFSLVSTLIAVAIGGIVAMLVATVITEAVKGQRAIIDRDEMSEFSLFIKAVLTTDSTCTAKLGGAEFSTTAAVPVKLDLEYQGIPNNGNLNPIAKDYKFSNDTLIVDDFTMENKGLPPVAMTVPVTDPNTGAVTMTNVTRYMARIKLQLKHINGTGYRARYFEIPVHVNASGRIASCNNEFSVADACSAMGFQYDPSAVAPAMKCKPQNACYAGGTYIIYYGGAGCYAANPATGACSCPAGYSDFPVGSVNLRAVNCGKNCYYTVGDTAHHCMMCPP